MKEEKISLHSFHIPVMGTGYTIDSPIKVAHFGINSVVSIIDHRLIEQMREFHCKQNNLQFISIPEEDIDCRAKRITAYLDLMDDLVDSNFEKLKKSAFELNSEITKYFEMLPDFLALKKEYFEMLKSGKEDIIVKQELLRKKILPGEIQVNIMTKIDRVNNTKNNEQLPPEYNDALAAFRGFANCKLNASLVLSAGLNPRLYGYMAGFNCLFPDKNGQFKKKIILKVSDYRSALIQGKFLAKKGLWVSEFRIESGLNCGGHAFATDGYLLGPILEEFKANKKELIQTLFEIYSSALKSNSIEIQKAPSTSLSIQGGVGNYEEHKFLMEYFEADSIGWGSPFLLVPEVVNIDNDTMQLIAHSDENGFYISNNSPMGVPFNAIRGTTAEKEKQILINKGKPGAVCTKTHLLYNNEFTERPICTASRQYQKLKIEELEKKNLALDQYKKLYNKIVQKECLCVGLGNSTAIKNNLVMYKANTGVTVCPGPNLAYFSKVVSLNQMVDHIYGRTNIIERTDRPNMFVQELKLYINYLKSKLEDSIETLTEVQFKYYQTFQCNLNDGIEYYKKLFSTLGIAGDKSSITILKDLNVLQNVLNNIKIESYQGITV